MFESRAVIANIRAFSSVETVFSDVSPVKSGAVATALKCIAVARRAQSEISITLATSPIWKETKQRIRKSRNSAKNDNFTAEVTVNFCLAI